MMWRLAIATIFVVAASTAGCLAADPRYPDWPCVQAKVPETSLAAVWAGPPLDEPGASAQITVAGGDDADGLLLGCSFVQSQGQQSRLRLGVRRRYGGGRDTISPPRGL